MKILSRDFTLKEKILIGILFIIILGFAYYQFVDQPIREAIQKAELSKQSLDLELETVNIKIEQLEKMQREIDRIIAEGTIAPMPSYNNNKAVNMLLNDVLGTYGYEIRFSELTREGDLIRRTISLEFNPPGFSEMRTVLAALENSEFRCLVDNVEFGRQKNRYGEFVYNASADVTFYETMVGGTPDSGLPEDESVQE